MLWLGWCARSSSAALTTHSRVSAPIDAAERFVRDSQAAAGDFDPRAVRERWTTPRGPMSIEFELNGRSRRVSAEMDDDYLDLCVLTTGLNPLIAGSGRRFAVHTEPVLGQIAFVVAVTDAERRVLERYRWPLESRPCA